jgi:acyl-CoA synthetase (AMP-forming)/AMP-acid ligase II
VSDPAPLYGAPTMWSLVEQRAAATPDAPAFVDESDHTITFGELRGAAERRAAALVALGVEPGTAVSWQLPTRIDTIVTSLALSRIGAVQNPILHLYREREVRFAIAQLRPAVFLTAGEWSGFDYGAMVRALVDELALPTAVVDPLHLPDDAPQSALPPAPVAADGDEVRWIYYTSGTTSDPKGVRHSDRTLMAGGEGLARASGYTIDDVGSIAFPFAHIAGPDYLVLLLAIGCSAAVVERFVPSDAVAFFRRRGVTFAGGSTAFYSLYLDVQRGAGTGERVLPALRALAGGGAPKPPALFDDVRRELGVPILHGYGMTEVPMIAMGRFDHTDEQLAYTDGTPIDGAEVHIAAPDGSLLPADRDGEICVRGPMVCKGYTDTALNADAFDADGFFRTGDLGHLRADSHLVVTGRLKDVIIRKGENISAREIEDVLVAHPKVRDVAVIGLPDAERGELVCAVVELADGAADLEFSEMVDACRAAGLMTQKIPERLEIVDALPRNDTLQKVVKQTLRERFATGLRER